MKLFISYRRSDTPREATELYYPFSLMLGRGNVFMDTEALRLGDDFP